jgi:cell division ATPase FtsA
LDIGSAASRAIIARGQHIFFTRAIPIGGEHFNKAAAAALSLGIEEAKLLRIKMCHAQTSKEQQKDKTAVSTLPEAGAESVDPPVNPAEMAQKSQIVETACMEPLRRLVEELDLCRRYYESTFPSQPVDRLIFVDGEARQRNLCQHIARELGLAAQLGDPMVRMGRISEVGIESGIDRRQPQPGWAVAIGLSMGPVKVEAAAKS